MFGLTHKIGINKTDSVYLSFNFSRSYSAQPSDWGGGSDDEQVSPKSDEKQITEFIFLVADNGVLDKNISLTIEEMKAEMTEREALIAIYNTMTLRSVMRTTRLMKSKSPPCMM